MKKKIIAVLLSVVMIVGILPLTASAAEWVLIVDGNEYTSEVLNSDIYSDGWWWDSSSEVLVLDGYDGGYIWANRPLEILLNVDSVNTITVPDGTQEYGIYTKGNCRIYGYGNLYINIISEGYDGVWTSQGDLTVDITGNLTVNATDDGLYADNYLNITNCNRLTVFAGDAGLCSYNRTVMIGGGTDFDITSGGYGIDSDGSVYIDDSASGKIESNNYPVVMWSSSSELCLYGSGAPIILKAGDGYKAVDCKNSSLSPVNNYQSYNVTGDPSSNYVLYDFDGFLRIADQFFTGYDLTSDIDRPDEGWYWNAEERLLTLDGYNGGYIYSLRSLNVYLTDGTSNNITVPEDGYYDGIYSYGDITIDGDGYLNISNNCGYDGISGDDINVNMSGKLTVEAKDDCISANKSLFVNGDCDMTLTSGDDSITVMSNIMLGGSGRTTINSGYYGLYTDNGSIFITDNRSLVVNSVQTAVKLWGQFSTLFLDGTGAPISLTAGAGYSAVLRGDDSTSPVGGSTFSYYYDVITGAPETEKVVYDTTVLRVAGNLLTGSDLLCDIDRAASEGWSWNAEDKELTLSGYDGRYIYAKIPLDIVVADGTDNCITVPDTTYFDGIRTCGDLNITGGGNLDVKVLSDYNGINTDYGDICIDMSGNLTVSTANYNGIYTDGELVIGGSGNVNVEARIYGLYGYDGVMIYGSGDVTIKSESDGIETTDGDVNLFNVGNVEIDSGVYGIYTGNGSVVLRGSGDVGIDGEYGAIKLWGTDSALVLNGTSKNITLDAASGNAAILRGDDDTSPVFGLSLEKYTVVEGAPNEEHYKLEYDSRTHINNIEISVKDPVVGEQADFNPIVTYPEGALTLITDEKNAPEWWDYDGYFTGVVHPSSEYDLYLYYAPNDGYVLDFDENEEYTGTVTINGVPASRAELMQYSDGNLFIAYEVVGTDLTDSIVIDDQVLTPTDLASDQTGDGWSWNASDENLTLNGYDGSYIQAYRDLEIVLADGSKNKITAPSDISKAGIYADNGSVNIFGNGDLTVNAENYWGYGIYGDSVSIDMNGKLTVNASDGCVSASNEVDIKGSGDKVFKSYSDCLSTYYGDVILSGSGSYTIESFDESGIFSFHGNVVFDGSGKISIKAGANGVLLIDSGKALLLNGTGNPIEISSTGTEGVSYSAVWNYADESANVEGTNLSYYDNVTGAPDESKVVYRHGELTLPFTDVKKSDWSFGDIAYVYENGLMGGTSETLFSPKVTTSRAMIVTILYRMEGEPAVDYAMSFNDVKAGQWYTEAIRWAQASGVVNGVSETKYAPNDPITREQMAAILYRYAEYKGRDVSARAYISGYTDEKDIHSYAKDYISWANAEGLINGVTATTIAPRGRATREQVAAILHRFCEN